MEIEYKDIKLIGKPYFDGSEVYQDFEFFGHQFTNGCGAFLGEDGEFDGRVKGRKDAVYDELGTKEFDGDLKYKDGKWLLYGEVA